MVRTQGFPLNTVKTPSSDGDAVSPLVECPSFKVVPLSPRGRQSQGLKSHPWRLDPEQSWRQRHAVQNRYFARTIKRPPPLI